MARKPRFSPGGLAYHVMNPTPGRVELFEDDGDYQAFEKVLIEALDLHRGMRLYGTVNPNPCQEWSSDEGHSAGNRWNVHSGGPSHEARNCAISAGVETFCSSSSEMQPETRVSKADAWVRLPCVRRRLFDPAAAIQILDRPASPEI